jgi:hypothetical protein
MKMKFDKIVNSTNIIETLDNYSISTANELSITDAENSNAGHVFYSDVNFWQAIIHEPEKYWNKYVSIDTSVVCNWISRIPGLYWANRSKDLRQLSNNEIVKTSNKWKEFTPKGKSQNVLGGIGTILLPPNEEGKRLISISSFYNASLGIPILVFPEVFDEIDLREGDLVVIRNARWQPISVGWSKLFLSTEGIPRGCIVIDTIDKIKIIKRNLPVSFNPFSIMEYQIKDSLVYDYVYLSVDNKLKNLRKEIESFFSYYANKEERYGKYLINPDLVQPLFDAKYMSPIDMQTESEKAQIELLYKRIMDQSVDSKKIEHLIELIPKYYRTKESIITLARNISLNTTRMQDDSVASMSIQLINASLKESKLPSLIDRIIFQYPEIKRK